MSLGFIQHRIKWDSVLLKKFSNTSHFKLLNQVRTEINDNPIKRNPQINLNNKQVRNIDSSNVVRTKDSIDKENSINKNDSGTVNLIKSPAPFVPLTSRQNKAEGLPNVDLSLKSTIQDKISDRSSLPLEINTRDQTNPNKDTQLDNLPSTEHNNDRPVDTDYDSNYKQKTIFRRSFRDRLNTIEMR